MIPPVWLVRQKACHTLAAWACVSADWPSLCVRSTSIVLKVALRWGLIAVGIALVGIQFVPYGRAHANPPVRAEPTWNDPRTRELAVRACFACHSNQVEWPWYSNVAPISWLVQRDVEQGRRKVNFSEFDRPQRDAQGAADQVEKGKMPQPYYVALHPEANLNPDERERLIRDFSSRSAGSASPSSRAGLHQFNTGTRFR